MHLGWPKNIDFAAAPISLGAPDTELIARNRFLIAAERINLGILSHDLTSAARGCAESGIVKADMIHKRP
jgi:hypothetical protein